MTPSAKPGESTTVKLHRALYAHEAIREAAATFSEFASFAVRVEDDHFVVEIGDIEADVDGDVVAEFCNFALANTALCGKAAHA